MASGGRSDAKGETLAIPKSMREEVDERDQLSCRICGVYLGDRRALHHISYGGFGARRIHAVDNLVTTCWMFPRAGQKLVCHELVHSDKGLWQPILQRAIATPGTTALQIKRWTENRNW